MNSRIDHRWRDNPPARQQGLQPHLLAVGEPHGIAIGESGGGNLGEGHFLLGAYPQVVAERFGDVLEHQPGSRRNADRGDRMIAIGIEEALDGGPEAARPYLRLAGAPHFFGRRQSDRAGGKPVDNQILAFSGQAVRNGMQRIITHAETLLSARRGARTPHPAHSQAREQEAGPLPRAS